MMEGAMTLDGMCGQAAQAVSDGVRRQQMPLTFLKSGEEASVLKVRGTDDFHHHLENLGFVPGAALRVMSEQSGNIIVEIKGAQIALDRATAQKILTC